MNGEGEDGLGVEFDGVEEGPGGGGDGVNACTARFIACDEGELRRVVIFSDEAQTHCHAEFFRRVLANVFAEWVLGW